MAKAQFIRFNCDVTDCAVTEELEEYNNIPAGVIPDQWLNVTTGPTPARSMLLCPDHADEAIQALDGITGSTL